MKWGIESTLLALAFFKLLIVIAWVGMIEPTARGMGLTPVPELTSPPSEPIEVTPTPYYPCGLYLPYLEE